MKSFFQFLERNLEDCCCLHIDFERIWHCGVMAVADQISLNPIFYFFVLSELLRISYWHYTALDITVYNTTYSAVQCIITMQCKAMQSDAMHSALQCLKFVAFVCKLHYGVEYNEGLSTLYYSIVLHYMCINFARTVNRLFNVILDFSVDKGPILLWAWRTLYPL